MVPLNTPVVVGLDPGRGTGSCSVFISLAPYQGVAPVVVNVSNTSSVLKESKQKPKKKTPWYRQFDSKKREFKHLRD